MSGKQSPAAAGSGGGASEFASGARILSIGVASTGICTFAYLALASKLLTPANYSRVSICWAILYVILCVIYRPVEQLLSRTIADRHARGESGHVLRTPAIIQATAATVFLITALLLRHQITERLFKGSGQLFWILVVAVLAYAASYFARGWLAGNKRFALYGGLMFLESTSRLVFAITVAIVVGDRLGPIALAMVVAPFVSLTVIPFAFRKVAPAAGPAGPATAREPLEDLPLADASLEGFAEEGVEAAATDLSLRHGGGFAVAVVAIMFSEQTLMNAGVLIVALGSAGGNITTGLAGFVFNVLLIVRAPLQLFQALQTSILPHLTTMQATGSRDEFRKAVRMTILVICAFAGAVSLGLLAVGPIVMSHLLQSRHVHGAIAPYHRFGLAIVGIGMGLHLVSGTLNQALLAQERHRLAACCWLVSALVFVLFVALPTIPGEILRVEVGYCLATALLAAMLGVAYRTADASRLADVPVSGDLAVAS